ncbi:Transglycosylase SLT domain protein [Planctomycetes bacterium Poly30]|uniref:Transglycosylase SLT domain protein n=2 Tax=Saltatorellus ferox TaxID=2528018 RepID=A0A518EWR6_9BACT|nr:Transglycosylase SLT domain protein [Planctomycetes bacterium Poly30]
MGLAPSSASDRRRRLRGGAAFLAAAILVPVAVLVSSQGLRSTLAAAPVRALRSVVSQLAGGLLEERGLDLVEGHAAILRAAAEEFEVPVNWLGGIMFAESRGRGGQTSSRGALGLMQLVKASARDAGVRAGIELPAEDAALVQKLLRDDALNVRLGAAHLSWLLEHRGDWSDEAVMVSYNAGRARLFQWIEKRGSYDAWVEAEEARARRGEATTGALAYARQVLAARDVLTERGNLGPRPRE